MRFYPACPVRDLAEGLKTVEVNGRDVALFRVDGQVYALDNICPHRGGLLGQGDQAGYLIYCPLHAWSFDIRTGQSRSNPGASVLCYQVRLVGDQVEVGPPTP